MNSYATTTQLVRGNALSDSASVVAMYLQLGRFSGTEAVNNLVPIRRSGTTHPYVQKKKRFTYPNGQVSARTNLTIEFLRNNYTASKR